MQSLKQLEKLAAELEKKLQFFQEEEKKSVQDFQSSLIDLQNQLTQETAAINQKLNLINDFLAHPEMSAITPQVAKLEMIDRNLYLAINDLKDINQSLNNLLGKIKS